MRQIIFTKADLTLMIPLLTISLASWHLWVLIVALRRMLVLLLHLRQILLSFSLAVSKDLQASTEGAAVWEHLYDVHPVLGGMRHSLGTTTTSFPADFFSRPRGWITTTARLDWSRVCHIKSHGTCVFCGSVDLCACACTNTLPKAHPVEWSSTSVTGKAEPMENGTEHMKCTTGGASPAALVSAVILLLLFFCLSDLL